MEIHFSGEAGETYQRVLRELHGLTVEIEVNVEDETYPGDSPARFDAQLLGPAVASEWYDAVSVRKFDEETGTGKGEPFTVRAERVTVH